MAVNQLQYAGYVDILYVRTHAHVLQPGAVVPEPLVLCPIFVPSCLVNFVHLSSYRS